MATSAGSGPLGGRPNATTRGHLSSVAIDLFLERGFDETSVDDIAAAAGIARRTLFRYYPSKNSLAWGEFDDHLDGLRGLLAQYEVAPRMHSLGEELRDAIIAFNTVPEAELTGHRRRMQLLLGVPALQAYSMVMYADWRKVIAEHCAHRLGVPADAHMPQTVAWMALGVALAAYEQWLAQPNARLEDLLWDGCVPLVDAVGVLEGELGPV